MGILEDDVARVRESADLVAIAGEHLALKRVGRRFVGLCPFHAEKTPSFSINPELGLYYCFGCQASGDAISFVREVEHLDFVGAVEQLARRSGITLRYDDASHGQERRRRERLVEATAAAVALYHRLLLESAEAGTARRYLRSRGFDGDAARRFSLGYAPGGYDTLSRALQQQKFSRDDLRDAGLSFVNRANRLQDQFRDRLMFPIFDTRGDAVAFGGRSLDAAAGPKYKNSPETALYRKHRVLYGLNWAKGEIVARGAAVLCEGYTDVMAFHLAGVPNAIATCGTALSDEHFEVVKNLARRLVLAYDADAAGQEAAARVYRWERRFEIELLVARLPKGRDPADVWSDDPAALQVSVEEATPFLRFRLDRVLAGAELSTPEGRARAAERVLPVLREHPNELVREGYIQQVAGELDVDHGWFKQQLARGGPSPTSTERAAALDAATPAAAPRVDPRELDALRFAMHDAGAVDGWLERELFADETARAAFDALAGAPDVASALRSADGEVRRLLERLAVEEPEADDEEGTVHARLVVLVVEPAAERLRARLLRDGNPDTSDVKQLLDRLRNDRLRGEWGRAEVAARELVRLIVQGGG